VGANCLGVSAIYFYSVFMSLCVCRLYEFAQQSLSDFRRYRKLHGAQFYHRPGNKFGGYYP
jgi:hypothetical protein